MIMAEGLYDKALVEAYTSGFEKLREEHQGVQPEMGRRPHRNPGEGHRGLSQGLCAHKAGCHL